MPQRSLLYFYFLLITFLVFCTAKTQFSCSSSWFRNDLLLFDTDSGWELELQKLEVSVYSRASSNPSHIARMMKAEIIVPSTPQEIVDLLIDQAYSKEYLNLQPKLLHGEIVEASEGKQIVYEIHGVPDYISMYPGIMYRDWVVARCVQKHQDGFIIVERSIEHPKFPNQTHYQRGWNIDSAVLILPIDNSASRVQVLHQQTLMCCIPQSIYDTQHPTVLADQLIRLREHFGGVGLCHGDLASSIDDFHASCHVEFLFPQTNCEQVWEEITRQASASDVNGHGYQVRTPWSNSHCLELWHYSSFFVADLHFEVINSSATSCAIRTASRYQFPSHFDAGANFCNIYNLINQLDGKYSMNYTNCLYKPHGTAHDTFCSTETRSWKDVLCSLDLFELICH